MIQITNVEVRSFDLDFLDLSWSIADTSERLSRYEIFVQRSIDGPAGPWVEIAGPLPGNETRLRDNDVNQIHNWRRYYYRIRVRDKDTQQEVVTESVNKDAPPDLIALEVRRRFELVLREYAGRKVVVFPAITSGFRCPSCYEVSPQGFSIGRQTTQNCQTCFDTTFVGGFNSPIIGYIQIDPTAQSIQRTDTQEQDRQDTTARLGAFPPLKPKDMLVEGENIRWEVQSVTPTRKGRATVRQSVVLHRIPTADIRYKIPINLDDSTMFSPEGEYTRHMDLQEADGPRLVGFD